MSARRPRGLHTPAGASWGQKMSWGPGFAGSGARPIRRTAQSRFLSTVSGPIGGAQASGLVNAAGAAQVSIGPSGFGTVWYPAQATISTTTGAADNSTCIVYLGAVIPQNIVGQSYAGGGDTVALAVPELAPGQLLIAVWAGGNPGDVATMNVVGNQDLPVAVAG